MTDMDYPRVLFVTPHAFNHVTGGGITFTSLFRGWPIDGLATAHSDPEPTSDDVCCRYYPLGPRELDYIWPLSRLRRKPAGDAATPAAAAAAANDQGSLIRRGALAVLGDPPPRRARLTRELAQWIAGFRPQLLYTILGDNAMMDLVEAIRRRYQLPLVVHIMDDWPAAAYRSGLNGPPRRRAMKRMLQHLFDVATARLAISPAMADAYRQRYDHPFQVFQNTIDVGRRLAAARPDRAVGTPAEILYVGSVFANAQLDSLVDCARSVARLSDAGLPVRLRISSPSGHAERYRERLAIHRAVALEDTIEDDDTFFRRIGYADLLLLPVNFDADSVRFIRYSMPTKVPAYLVSGTPILAYGPLSTAQIAYANDTGWALVVGKRDERMLDDAIARAIADRTLRRGLTAAAARAARANHDAGEVRSRFQTLLCQAAAPAS